MEHSPVKATALRSTLWFYLIKYLVKYLLVAQLENPDLVFQIALRRFHNFSQVL